MASELVKTPQENRFDIIETKFMAFKVDIEKRFQTLIEETQDFNIKVDQIKSLGETFEKKANLEHETIFKMSQQINELEVRFNTGFDGL